jgi:N-methylhydantoinase B
MEAPGSGGFGPPAARDQALIRKDVADGYVSGDAARPEYGLAGVLSQDKSAPTRS